MIAFLIERGFLDLTVLKQLATPEIVTCGLLVVGLLLLIQSWRWWILLRARQFEVSFREAWQLFLIGVFFNYALPGAIGGDVVKAFYIAKDHPKRRMEAVLTVALDRILGLYSMVAMAVMTIFINWERIESSAQLHSMAVATIVLFLVMTGFWVTAFSRRIKRWGKVEGILVRLPLGTRWLQLYQSAQAYGNARLSLLGVLALSAVVQLLSILFMVMVAHAIGEGDMPLAAYFFAVPLGSIVSSIPIAPAGLGVGQIAFLVLFQMYSGRPSLLGQTAITAFQLTSLAWGFLGAFFYLRRDRRPV